MTTVLITGFGRFPGAPFNPSGPLALALAKRRRPAFADVRRAVHVFQTSYAAVDGDHDNAAKPYGDLWRAAYQALTARFPMTVIAVSSIGAITAGPWKGRKCVGCSLAYGPGGIVLAEGPADEEADFGVHPLDPTVGDAVLDGVEHMSRR